MPFMRIASYTPIKNLEKQIIENPIIIESKRCTQNSGFTSWEIRTISMFVISESEVILTVKKKFAMRKNAMVNFCSTISITSGSLKTQKLKCFVQTGFFSVLYNSIAAKVSGLAMIRMVSIRSASQFSQS